MIENRFMNGDLFSTVHNSLTVLLTLQKKNQPLVNGLIEIRKILAGEFILQSYIVLFAEKSPKTDSAELLAVCSALIVGIRVLADGSLRDESLPLVIEQYASIIDFAFTEGGLQVFQLTFISVLFSCP